MVVKQALLGVFAAALLSVPAHALDVISGSISITPGDASQLGRLSRNGVPQDWAGSEQYPGTVNNATTYNFTTKSVTFGPNSSQDVFYDIDVDDVATDLFASAYLDGYDPANKQTNWLGDAGTSGDYFGVDELFFDVVVPKGHTLDLVFNSTNAGGVPTSTANYQVYAYSDNEYDENFSQVSAAPEPGAWALMLGGIGMLGAFLRIQQARRREDDVKDIATA